jgi:alpha-N-acetylglucosamine transferase
MLCKRDIRIKSPTWRSRLCSKVIGLILLLLTFFGGLHLLWLQDGGRKLHKSASRHRSPLSLWTGTSGKTSVSSRFAYCQYVTNRDYLCNSLMIFESLSRYGSRADLLLMYPQHWDIHSSSVEAHLLRKARRDYEAKLLPIQIQHFDGENTWADSFTKLLAFNQTQYERVISLDSDANVLKVG